MHRSPANGMLTGTSSLIIPARSNPVISSSIRNVLNTMAVCSLLSQLIPGKLVNPPLTVDEESG